MDQPNTIDTADGVVVQADGTTLLAKLCFDGRARLGAWRAWNPRRRGSGDAAARAAP